MRTWTRRPSLTVGHWIAFALALVCALAGWLLFVFERQVALWLLLSLLAIAVGLKGGPWFVRLLERMGLFGRVLLDRDRLAAGRGARALDLARAFRVTARLHQKEVRHEFRLRDAGVGTIRRTRTERKAVSILVATIEQEETRWTLVADDARAPPLPTYDVSGLSCRRAPVGKPGGGVIRMHVEDLIDILHRVKDAQGYAAVTAPDTDEVEGDPRLLFWPTWKSIAGIVVLLAAGIAVAVEAMERAPPEQGRSFHIPTVEELAQSAERTAKVKGERWIGKRVAFRETGLHHVYGIVRSFELRSAPADHRGARDFALLVEVNEILDVLFKPAPEGTRARVAAAVEEVALGTVVTIAPEHVYESPLTKPAVPPGK